MRGIDSDSVDLIYLDPPFNTGKQWHAPIGSDAEGASFNDIWAWDSLAEAEGETLATSVKRQWLNDLRVESPVRAVVETAEATAGEEMGAYLAFMAMRLVEMQRILKPSGSIYLHCDPHASHYLKAMLDAIFEPENFVNEVIWKRTTTRGDAARFARIHDSILYYKAGKNHTWNKQYEAYSEATLKQFHHRDSKGKYRGQKLTIDSGLAGGGYEYKFHGHYRVWGYPEHRMRELEDQGLIHIPKNGGVPQRKFYLKDAQGRAAGDVVIDIPPARKKERTGFPTQKPLALLERIIGASSNAGDVVLDPFCGCATACVAAEKLGRQWIGIDVSKLAVKLCIERIEKMQNETGQTNFGIPYHDPIARTDAPVRTDRPAEDQDRPIDPSLPKDEVKEQLYGHQAGNCNGCRRHFTPEFADLMDLDHIKARSKGGQHTWSNVQLLCRTCNVRKGSGSMAQLRKRLQTDVA